VSDLIKLSDLKDSASVQLILDNMPEELRETIKVTPAQLKMLEAHAAGNSALGLKNRIPIKCEGSKCPYASVCMYYNMGLAPVGHGCVEEKVVIDQLVTTLIRDFNVDPENIVELTMIEEYIDAEIQEIRAQRELAINQLIVESVSNVDPITGTIFYEKKENPAVAVKERAKRLKAQLRKDFLATREIRKKYNIDKSRDESKEQSEKLKRYQQIVEQNKARIEEATFTEIGDKK